MIDRLRNWLTRPATAAEAHRASTKLSPAYEKRRIRELRDARERFEQEAGA